MEKAHKVKVVEDLQNKLQKANATFIAEYKGIKAGDMSEMRRALRGASIDLKIVRNTLSRRALKGTPIEQLSEHLKGPTAIAISYKDAAAAAKALTQFAKEQPKLKLKIGTLGSKIISLNEIIGLAELPPREVLIGRMLGSMMSPVSGFVRVLGGVPTTLLYALNAIKDKKAAQA
ncbi:MAG: 50S ribosomal protein L10 [Deltaproteobacteria bacterium]|nr:50S ribosomal protein L10 [Deltaproteobacteria bacterium]